MRSTETINPFWIAEDVAICLKCSVHTIRDKTYRELIPYVKILGGGIRYRKESIDAQLIPMGSGVKNKSQGFKEELQRKNKSKKSKKSVEQKLCQVTKVTCPLYKKLCESATC